MKLNDVVNGYTIVGISRDSILTLKDGKYKSFPPDAKEFEVKAAPEKAVKKAVKKKSNVKKSKGIS